MPGSFNGHDLVDGFTGKMFRPSGTHVVDNSTIALVVEESIHFQHITWLDGYPAGECALRAPS